MRDPWQTGPIRVVQVDVDGPVPDVSAVRERGPDYTGAFVIVFRDGRPLGHVEFDLDRPELAAAEVRQHIVAALGDVWAEAPPPRATVADSDLPFITAVVPSAFSRGELLERCVEGLAAQDYPAFEVIVVDNRPRDTPERADLWRRLGRHRRVTVVAEPLPGSAAARNRGIGLARGSVVAFVDDDAVPGALWLRAIGRRFALEPQTDAVTGMFLPAELETPSQILFERSGTKFGHRYQRLAVQGGRAEGRGRFQMRVWSAENGPAESMVLPVYRAGQYGVGANMAFRVDALHALGGFDDATGVGTPSLGGVDLLLFVRFAFAGRRMTFDPEVVMFHTHVRTYDELRHKMYSYGSGYTAMLTALVLSDPRHVVGLAGTVAHYGRLFARRFLVDRRAAAQTGDYPRELTRTEVRGLIVGPWRYLYSRYRTRRTRRALAASGRSGPRSESPWQPSRRPADPGQTEGVPG